MTLSIDNILSPRTANAIALGALAYSIAKTLVFVLKSGPRPGITQSPLKTLLPVLSEQEKAQLPYPTDALPGARDVSSPYGSTRIYEWGPESGRKVLLVHGISTPSMALGALGHALADRGCRVLLFDLFGRGFSDNPDDVPQDARLFCSQILICLASSPLSWTDRTSGRFTVIGYSLGGGIAASFTAHFPDLVSSLVLISPSGLLRSSRVSLRTRFLYSQGVLPEPILTYLVRRRLRASVGQAGSSPSSNAEARPPEPVETEVPDHDLNSALPLSKNYLDMSPVNIVKFQIEHHQAFVHAYMSSMRHGPIMTEHTTWRLIGQRLSLQEKSDHHVSCPGRLDHGKVLIICANEDTSIVTSDLVPDAVDAFEGNVEFRHLEAGHEVPISKSEEVAAAIWEFWSG